MFVSSELGGRGVVKGAPYSATAVSETRQTLTDGNRIVRSSTAKLYRDAQGRTRQEQGKDVVFINDVVAGKRFVLNSDRKTARELPAVRTPLTPPVPPVPGAAPVPPAPPAPPQMSSEEARSWAEEMRQWAREFSSRMLLCRCCRRPGAHSAGVRQRRVTWYYNDKRKRALHSVTAGRSPARRDPGSAATRSSE